MSVASRAHRRTPGFWKTFADNIRGQ